ncbi:MAG: GldG family protein, partial [Deltaproteobacteria bacterium]|nr:GldG family protein [Deltaproteobacteria bacterium]
GERDHVKDVLQRYAYLNPKISFKFVDPEREPLKAKEAGYRFPGNVQLTYAGKHQMADRADEESISNTLRRILKTERKKVYFLTGHGERNLASSEKDGLQVANRALENEGYEIAPLNLVTTPGVPQDAAVVVVASPTKPVLSNEIDALKAYLARGGRVLVLLEAYQDGGLKGFLAGYGINLDDGIILDYNQLSQSLRVSPVMPLAFQYGPTRITRDFKNTFTIFPLSRSVTLNKETKGVSLQPIVSTMASSYEKLGKDWLKANKAAYDPKTDKKGPFNLGALAEIKPTPAPKAKEPASAEKPEEEKQGYLAVYGDMDFAANAYFNLFGNGDLFLNTVNFLAAEEQQIMVREALKAQLLTLSTNQYWVLFLVSVIFGPLIMVVVGISAYRTRRARR